MGAGLFAGSVGQAPSLHSKGEDHRKPSSDESYSKSDSQRDHQTPTK